MAMALWSGLMAIAPIGVIVLLCLPSTNLYRAVRGDITAGLSTKPERNMIPQSSTMVERHCRGTQASSSA